MKEEWKCVLTHGVPYFVKGIPRNALTNFNVNSSYQNKDKFHIITCPDINGYNRAKIYFHSLIAIEFLCISNPVHNKCSKCPPPESMHKYTSDHGLTPFHRYLVNGIWFESHQK